MCCAGLCETGHASGDLLQKCEYCVNVALIHSAIRYREPWYAPFAECETSGSLRRRLQGIRLSEGQVLGELLSNRPYLGCPPPRNRACHHIRRQMWHTLYFRNG